MVINDEIKFPRAIQVDAFKTSPRVEHIDRVAALEKIGRFRQRWLRYRQGRPRQKTRNNLPTRELNDLRDSIAKANADMAAHDLFIRLVLASDDEGYYIVVYDCTDGIACTIINDIDITVEEIPHLLANIAQETGLLVDKIL